METREMCGISPLMETCQIQVTDMSPLTAIFRTFHMPPLTAIFRTFHLPPLTAIFRTFHVSPLTAVFRTFGVSSVPAVFPTLGRTEVLPSETGDEFFPSNVRNIAVNGDISNTSK